MQGNPAQGPGSGKQTPKGTRRKEGRMEIGHLSSVERSELDDKWFLEFPSDSFHVQRNLHRQYIRVYKS